MCLRHDTVEWVEWVGESEVYLESEEVVSLALGFSVCTLEAAASRPKTQKDRNKIHTG